MGSLAAVVRARNEVNAACNEFLRVALENFGPLVGGRILRADGWLLKKFEDLVPGMSGMSVWPGGPSGVQLWRHFSVYSLSFGFRACVVEDGVSYYAEEIVTVGELDGGVLKSVRPFAPWRVDYSVEEVVRARERFSAAERELVAARSGLYPFGEA